MSQVFTVEQINNQLRSLIEGNIGTVWIQAEISNFKPHSSGHFYFSLKDSKSQISAMMFRGFNSKLKFKPHDGLEVIIKGKITVYEPRGTYSIACETMEPVGAGALQKQFEQLKEKLKSEGLFSADRKKEIPHYPKKIAIVTSPTGAAIQDILNILNRRAKNIEVIVVPAVVQGSSAAASLIESFGLAEKLKPDVIIIGRGGGSIEDMWCFNDETLARKIAASVIPVISAVGHEIDFTICDFVADLRAPTPSAAAELVAKSSAEVIQRLGQLHKLLLISLQKLIHNKKQKLALAKHRLVDPQKKLQDFSLRNDDLYTRLEVAIDYKLTALKKDIQVLRSKMVSPEHTIMNKKMRLQKNFERMNLTLKHYIQTKDHQIKNMMSLLDSFSPLKVVDRGYSIAKVKDKVIRSVKQVKIGDEVTIKMTDGILITEVKDFIQ